MASGKKKAAARTRKPARRKAASHARATRFARARETLAGWLKRPQNIVFFSIFAVVCFTFPPLMRYIGQHSYFALGEVEVLGTERLAESRVQRWLGLVEGGSIWSASPRELEEELMRQPAIAHAEVRRLLPDRLRVRVEEAPAHALLRAGEKFYLVGIGGDILDPIAQPSAELPIVSLDEEELPSRAELREALEVVALLEEGAGRVRVSEVEIERDGETRGLVAHSSDGRLTVRLGWGDWPERLSALGRVVADASGVKAAEGFIPTGHLAGTVDVIDPETVVARWRSRGGAA